MCKISCNSIVPVLPVVCKTQLVAQAKKLINVNQDFKQVVKNYSELLVKQVTLEQNKETYRIRNINLVETRKSKLNDPYGKEELQRIDEELKNVQDGLNTFENDLLLIKKCVD